MAGRPGRSGPPGNLHATKRPWAVFWRRRALRREDRWILGILESYVGELVVDKGGAKAMTAGERRMAEIAQTARGATLLILAEAARRGFVRQVDGSWDLAPGARELARFLGVEQRALVALGLERRRQPVETLDKYLRRRYGRPGGVQDPDQAGQDASAAPESEIRAPAGADGGGCAEGPGAGPDVARIGAQDDGH